MVEARPDLLLGEPLRDRGADGVGALAEGGVALDHVVRVVLGNVGCVPVIRRLDDGVAAIPVPGVEVLAGAGLAEVPAEASLRVALVAVEEREGPSGVRRALRPARLATPPR